MMTLQCGEHSVLSHCHTVHGQRRGAILSGHLTTIAMTMGGQEPMVVGGCIETSCWHVMLALPAIVALSYACAFVTPAFYNNKILLN
jgi:hypothetical protein